MSDSLFIVAIDFGTSYSGYCFWVQSSVDHVRMVSWGHEVGLRTPKTPTCVLLDEHGQLTKFGYEAVMTYTRMGRDESARKLYFNNFKMQLYNKTVSRDLMVTAANGKPFRAMKVFSESLRYLKDHALATIGEHTSGKEFIASDVTWVLTVPAIWSAAAKQFMREAAVQAGLVSDLHSNQLIVALEPESVWCKHLPSKGFVAEGASQDNRLEQIPGTQYVVVDCDGKHDDITLVLLGRRGSGKSSCGNTILGRKVFQSFLSTTPVTTECEEHTTYVQERKVTVIDTPDFFGDFLPDPDSHKKKCISMIGQESSVFLLVIQLGLLTVEEKKIVKQIKRTFGKIAKQNIIIVFSYGDQLQVPVRDYLKKKQPQLKDIVRKCGKRYHVFNNTDTSSDTQVTELLEKIDSMLAKGKTGSKKHKSKAEESGHKYYNSSPGKKVRYERKSTDFKDSSSSDNTEAAMLQDRRSNSDKPEAQTNGKEAQYGNSVKENMVGRRCDPTEAKGSYRQVSPSMCTTSFKYRVHDVIKSSPITQGTVEDGDERKYHVNKRNTKTEHSCRGPETQPMCEIVKDLKNDDHIMDKMMEDRGRVHEMQNTKDSTQDSRKDRVTHEVKLVLLGRRGSGKSSCGNTILGRKVFQSFLSTTPVTTECEEHTTYVQERKVTVIDTPDFFGDFLPDPDSHKKKCISMIGQESSVFLLVIQLGRFTEGDRRIVTQIQEAFGSSVTQNMIVLFSYGDDLEVVTIEDFLKHAQPELKNLVEKCGNRYHVFNNRDTRNIIQVTDLLEKTEDMLEKEGAQV